MEDDYLRGVGTFGIIITILLLISSFTLQATEPDPSEQTINPYTPPPQPEGETPEIPNEKHIDLSSSAPVPVDTGG